MNGSEANERALAGASAATAGALELIEFARHAPHHDLAITDVIEQLADAAKLAIEVSARTDDEAMQLLAALSKFLEGWVG